ncbi:hypothetical protein [Dongia deserti]|uniref:hypothetical protein n=1 Tax=Dongia deserti TaxID=2268030 RepID=UPI0013C4A3C3|nr:hypothetical protein [Dongia deserti]
MKTSTSIVRAGVRVASARAGAVELRRRREMLIARAALERAEMRDATQDLLIASDRIARFVMVGATLIRRYWLPLSVLLAGGLFKRTRPVLRFARTGLAIWQTARLLRAARR